jgi:hypothetical protein
MGESQLFEGMTEKANRITFDVIRKGLIRVDTIDRDGKSVFHLHRKIEIYCKRCRNVCDDELINTCPKCGANANDIPGVLVSRPIYRGAWGRLIETWLKNVLEEIFRDGTLEWVDELDSWFFTPTNAVLDRKLASKKVLDLLALE